MLAGGLSVCIIGRNEAANLRRLASSLQPVTEGNTDVETVYVDSASTDGSVTIARELFDTVVSLHEGDGLCASLGRYWGTCMAQKKWILYLDGDMQLQPEFVSFLRGWDRMQDVDGVVGRYINLYDDATQREDVLAANMREGVTTHFGGAVLLRREAVTGAGNWNPWLFSNEEIELYARLCNRGHCVWYVDVPMILHHTHKIPKWLRLIDNAFPREKGLGKKYFGFGQILACKFRHGGMLALVRTFPYPFVFWTLILTGLGSLFLGLAYPGLVLLLTAVLYIVVKKGVNYLALYTLLLLQAVTGFFKYDESVLLEPVEVWRKQQ